MLHNYGSRSIKFHEEIGVWGLAHRKMFEVTPCRTSENALLHNRFYLFPLLIFMLRRISQPSLIELRRFMVEVERSHLMPTH